MRVISQIESRQVNRGRSAAAHNPLLPLDPVLDDIARAHHFEVPRHPEREIVIRELDALHRIPAPTAANEKYAVTRRVNDVARIAELELVRSAGAQRLRWDHDEH